MARVGIPIERYNWTFVTAALPHIAIVLLNPTCECVPFKRRSLKRALNAC
jgi:hypothetical protein